MKFGIRECANIVFRAKQETQIGTATFHVGQPVLYIDTATTSTLEQASTTVYAQGGRGNSRLIAWEGDKTLTFTVTDALLSPIGFSVLSGAGLFRRGDGKNSTLENAGTGAAQDLVHFHMTTMATSNGSGVVDLSAVVGEFGADAKICATDAPLYVLGVDADGSIDGSMFQATVTTTGDGAYKTITLTDGANQNVMVDYYVDLPGVNVWEADITPDTFGGYYYVEADTLFRQQSTGKDLPANLTLPNVKIQSAFTITMAGTGDPSTFDFTMDAFPGYTYFDKSKKVLCVLQIVDGSGFTQAAAASNPVMPHNDVKEHEEVLWPGVEADDDNVDDSIATNNPAGE